MNILSMTATFGGLSDQTLTLTPGLNLLELPNEGGKSTWCAFLRAMFYGVETRKGRENSEKNRFAPWSGAPMKGSVDLIWNGQTITLRRFAKGASPFGGFQAVYTGTEVPVPHLTADNVGETILGCSREVFERTCFIRQGGMTVTASGDLEQRLAALASSGEEDVSYSQTAARLKEWRNVRRVNRSTGSIPRLQAQLDAGNAQLTHMAALERTIGEADGQEKELLRRQEALQADLDALALQQEQRYRQAYAAAQAKLAQAVAAEPPRRTSFRPLFLTALLAALSGAGLLIARLVPLGAALLALGAALGLASAVLTRRQEKRYQAQTAIRQQQIDAAQEELAALERWEPPADDSSQLRGQLDALSNALAALRTRKAQAAGELRAMGGPDQLRARAAELQAQIAAQEEEYAALTLAMEALEAANTQLQRRFAPAVSARAGELLSRLTGGRYDSLTFTRSFEALASAQGDQPHSAALLSQGTADQAYLALRLAICGLTLSQDDPAPLVLDDALASFDDRRLALALELLAEEAQGRQVLLFTCQSRERAARGPGLH